MKSVPYATVSRPSTLPFRGPACGSRGGCSGVGALGPIVYRRSGATSVDEPLHPSGVSRYAGSMLTLYPDIVLSVLVALALWSVGRVMVDRVRTWWWVQTKCYGRFRLNRRFRSETTTTVYRHEHEFGQDCNRKCGPSER